MATIDALSRLSSADDSSSATEVVRHDDTRLVDDRDPTAHAATHATAGSDPVSPASIGASATGHDHAATYQPLDSDLTTIAGLSATTDNVIQSVSSAWASRTPAQLKTTLALAKGDVGLGNVDNTSDVNKPVSTAQQTALDGKQPIDSDLTAIAALSPSNGHMMRRQSGVWVAQSMADIKTALTLVKADVGLGNVDNTSDAGKPVSTAVQAALDALRHTGVTIGGASSVNTASTSYITLGGSDLAVTFTFPPSGRFTVMLRTSISCSSTTLNHFGVLSFEVRDTNSSGSQLFAAGDDWAAFGQSITASEALNTSSSFVTLTGFPTSGTGYIRAMYRSTNAANTATYAYRSLLVIPST